MNTSLQTKVNQNDKPLQVDAGQQAEKLKARGKDSHNSFD